MPQDTVEIIRQRLTQRCAPAHLEILDESAQHAGHAGARAGGGHYRVLVVSDLFEGLPRPARHRLIYAALAAEMHTLIHALGLETLTPGEWAAR